MGSTQDKEGTVPIVTPSAQQELGDFNTAVPRPGAPQGRHRGRKPPSWDKDWWMWKFPLTGGEKPRLGTSRGIEPMVGAEAEIKDKDERKIQIPKAWPRSASCCNLSTGELFLFVFFF